MEERLLFQYITQRLKSLREERGITQEAFYCDTRIHIGRIEQGRTNISLRTLHNICAYFGISVAEFFFPLSMQEVLTRDTVRKERIEVEATRAKN